jgi:DUF917 family protein
MTFKEMLEKSVLFTMSLAWQLGRAVMRARLQHTNVVEAVTNQQNGIILLTGKVIHFVGAIVLIIILQIL